MLFNVCVCEFGLKFSNEFIYVSKKIINLFSKKISYDSVN